MAQNTPPYHVPVYIAPVNLSGQVAEVSSPSSGSDLHTGYPNPPGETTQQWNIDPFDISSNQYFIKLNSKSNLVIQSSEDEYIPAFLAVQGDRYANQGIQLWVFEQQPEPDTWRFKNYKTNRYLYLNYDGRGQPGQPGVPIVTSSDPVAGYNGHNADWRISEVQK